MSKPVETPEEEAVALEKEVSESIKSDVANMLNEGEEEKQEKEEEEKVEDKVKEEIEDKDKEKEGEVKEEEIKEEPSEHDVLISELNRLSQVLQTPAKIKEEVKKEEKKEETKIEEEVEDKLDATFSAFIKEEDFKDTFDREEIKKLNAAFSSAMSTVLDKAKMTQPTSTPEVNIEEMVDKKVSYYEAARDFWAANSDLLPVKDYVVYTAKTIQENNKDADLISIFKKTEEEVRKVIKQKKEDVETEEELDPALAATQRGAHHRNKGGEPLTPIQKEILELMKLDQ